MPIRHVEITDFKSILKQRIELGQLNVFIGTNGSGKSNFLEAIGMLSAAATGEIDYSRLDDRGVRLSSPEVFRSAFSNKPRKKAFVLEGGFNNLSYRSHILSGYHDSSSSPWRFHTEALRRGADYSERIAGRSNSYKGIAGINADLGKLKYHQGIIPIAESFGVLTSDEIEALSGLKEYAIYSLSTPILRGVARDESRRVPLGLYGGGMAAALDDVLKRHEKGELHHIEKFFSLLVWFAQISIRSPESVLQSSLVQTGKRVISFKDRFMPKNFKELYAYDVSEGALYILFVLLLLAHPQSPKIFALDNVDNALNPGLVVKLMKYIDDALKRDKHKQIFMTTHNPTTLDALDLFDPRHKLFVVKRNREGATEFETIVPPEGMTKEEWQEEYGYMKLSEIWLSGAIEGINSPRDF